jgi:hypothetical protein
MAIVQDGVRTTVSNVDMEEVEDLPIHVWVLFIARQNHNPWVFAPAEAVLIPLHVIGCIGQLKGLVTIQHIIHNENVPSVCICKVVIAGDG